MVANIATASVLFATHQPHFWWQRDCCVAAYERTPRFSCPFPEAHECDKSAGKSTADFPGGLGSPGGFLASDAFSLSLFSRYLLFLIPFPGRLSPLNSSGGEQEPWYTTVDVPLSTKLCSSFGVVSPTLFPMMLGIFGCTC